jgi:hypothetical protein
MHRAGARGGAGQVPCKYVSTGQEIMLAVATTYKVATIKEGLLCFCRALLLVF